MRIMCYTGDVIVFKALRVCVTVFVDVGSEFLLLAQIY